VSVPECECGCECECVCECESVWVWVWTLAWACECASVSASVNVSASVYSCEFLFENGVACTPREFHELQQGVSWSSSPSTAWEHFIFSSVYSRNSVERISAGIINPKSEKGRNKFWQTKSLSFSHCKDSVSAGRECDFYLSWPTSK
jgi:hypothetical protein